MPQLTLFLLVLAFFVCKPAGTTVLTDGKVKQYIQAYKNLKKVAPDLARQMAEKQVPAESEGKSGFEAIDQAIKSSGLSGYREFVELNYRIGWAFSTLQAKRSILQFEKMHSISYAEIDKYLADPAVPEETKKSLRLARREIEENWKKNKKWAEVSMSVAGWLTDDEALEIIGRHRADLEEAYAGMKIPEPEFFGQKL